MIVIVDYGMGNLGSVKNMLKRIKIEAVISSEKETIRKAEKLILPGVGAFDKAMQNLQDLDLIDVLHKKVLDEKTPILGICLGMQLLTRKSEEGKLQGLGWIDAETKKFKFTKEHQDLKIPHMGWNTINIIDSNSLFNNMEGDARFYFVHSYHIVCKQKEDCQAKTEYGYPFTSAIKKGNIMGTQFHPEKSHKFGMNILKNFTEM